jgi:hypothetical protein
MILFTKNKKEQHNFTIMPGTITKAHSIKNPRLTNIIPKTDHRCCIT